MELPLYIFSRHREVQCGVLNAQRRKLKLEMQRSVMCGYTPGLTGECSSQEDVLQHPAYGLRRGHLQP
jgi:hypothetical protein